MVNSLGAASIQEAGGLWGIRIGRGQGGGGDSGQSCLPTSDVVVYSTDTDMALGSGPGEYPVA